jgi:hypothetical protein
MNQKASKGTSSPEIFLYGILGAFISLILQGVTRGIIYGPIENLTILTLENMGILVLLVPTILFVFVLFEEIVKYFLLRKIQYTFSFLKILFTAFLFGFGFFSFEIFLSTLHEAFSFSIFHFLIFFIHSVTAFSWLLGMHLYHKYSRKFFVFLGGCMAIAVHFLYNFSIALLSS